MHEYTVNLLLSRSKISVDRCFRLYTQFLSMLSEIVIKLFFYFFCVPCHIYVQYIDVYKSLGAFGALADIYENKMDDSVMYGGHAAVSNHSMGNILASSVPYGYNIADSFGPVGHNGSEDICDILQQIISISSQSLDEAQMRFVNLQTQSPAVVMGCF